MLTLKNNREDFYPVALTVSSSDSGGSSGVQADLRTFNAAGVFGCSVITAVTAQNPCAIKRQEVLSPDLVTAQLSAVIPALAVKAVKIGMLGNSAVLRSVCDFFRKHKLPLIVDASMINRFGEYLLEKDALLLMKNDLLSLASMIILNTREAEWLLNRKLTSAEDRFAGALALAEEYKCQILLENDPASDSAQNKICDIAVLDGELFLLASPVPGELDAASAQGMDCAFSSGIAAMISTGSSWKNALCAAKAHVYGSLCETAHVGKELDCMYPPLEDYSSQVSLRLFRPNSDKKGRK